MTPPVREFEANKGQEAEQLKQGADSRVDPNKTKDGTSNEVASGTSSSRSDPKTPSGRANYLGATSLTSDKTTSTSGRDLDFALGAKMPSGRVEYSARSTQSIQDIEAPSQEDVVPGAIAMPGFAGQTSSGAIQINNDQAVPEVPPPREEILVEANLVQEEDDQTPDESNDDEKEKAIGQAEVIRGAILSRRRMVFLACAVVLVIVLVAVITSVTSSNRQPSVPSQAPTPSPTASPTTRFRSFETTEELYAAVDAYLEDNSSNTTVAATYGHPIGAWDVSRIEDFAELFSTDRNILTLTFNEDVSEWDMSSATILRDMFYCK